MYTCMYYTLSYINIYTLYLWREAVEERPLQTMQRSTAQALHTASN